MDEKSPKYYEMIYINELSGYSDPELRAMQFSEDGPSDKHRRIMEENPVYLTRSRLKKS